MSTQQSVTTKDNYKFVAFEKIRILNKKKMLTHNQVKSSMLTDICASSQCNICEPLIQYEILT